MSPIRLRARDSAAPTDPEVERQAVAAVQKLLRDWARQHDWKRLGLIKRKLDSWKSGADPTKAWLAEQLTQGGKKGLTAWQLQKFKLPRGDLAAGARKPGRQPGKRKAIYNDEIAATEFTRLIAGVTDRAEVGRIRNDVVSRMSGRGPGGKHTTPESKARRLRLAISKAKARERTADV